MSEFKRKSNERRILVTGATGFVGKKVCHVLEERGFNVVALSRSPSPTTTLWSLDWTIEQNEILLKSVDVVIHLAAYIPKNYDDLNQALPCYLANSLGTLKLLQAAKQVGVNQFIFASTCAIYAPSSGETNEQSATMPERAAPYLASKLAAEAYVAAGGFGTKMVTTTLRFASIYGPGMPNSGLLPVCVRQLKTHGQFTVNDGNRYRTDLVHVNDVVESIYSALTHSVYGTFNIASGSTITPYEVATTVASNLGIPIAGITIDPATENHVPYYGTLNIDKARANLDYKPIPFDIGVASYINSLK
jgi:nucleoside-diphosphate-sugar epimerase